jgi:hypothetical protein
VTPSPWRRTAAALLGALAVAAGSLVVAPDALAAPRKADVVSVFPTDALTVADPAQATGRRVALPTAGCGAPISCGLVQQLNQLDGFDLDPRIAVRYDGPVDPAAAAARITVEGARGPFRTGVDRVVWDPTTNTLYAHPARQLAPGTTYRLRIKDGPVNRSGEATFTTLSATDGLLDLRRQLDDGSAFGRTGITPGLVVDRVVPATGTTITWTQDLGATFSTPQAVPVPQAGTGARLAFGSYRAPSWLTPEVTIPQTPTRDTGPAPVAAAQLPFVAVLPAGTPPPGGWPVAVFGHGFTSNDTAVLLSAVANAAQGIATIGTNVVGHGFGPRSSYTVTSGGTTTQLLSYGRGVDQNGDGVIGSTEGSSSTGASAAQSSRDALRQTAADVMSLVRSVGGADLDGDGRPDLSGTGVTYFGQSFGGIYGTMLTGADSQVARSVLNVPGGPIAEIARIAPAFRPLTTAALQQAGLLNSADATRGYFEEQLPLRGEGPLTLAPRTPSSAAIQEYLARATWLSRPGSPETFAPLIAPQRVLLQVAYADQTVPNPTAYTLVDAGGLWSRTSLYRNDRTANAANNPHSFLLQLALPAAAQGQAQVAAFLGRGQVVDPDQRGAVWEVPIADRSVLLALNFPNPALRPAGT